MKHTTRGGFPGTHQGEKLYTTIFIKLDEGTIIWWVKASEGFMLLHRQAFYTLLAFFKCCSPSSCFPDKTQEHQVTEATSTFNAWRSNRRGRDRYLGETTRSSLKYSQSKTIFKN